jgi:hypothetical protein
MTLSNQLDAASSSRKSTKKSSRQQKKTSTTTPPQNADVKTNRSSKQKKSETNDRKDALSSSQGTLLRRSLSIRKHLSNLVNSGGSSLKRSLSFGKGLNDHLSRTPWSTSLQSLREDVPSSGSDETPAFSSEVRESDACVFDSRKLVTRTQSLLVQRRSKDEVDAKDSKVSGYLCLTSVFSLLMMKIKKKVFVMCWSLLQVQKVIFIELCKSDLRGHCQNTKSC